MILSPARTQRGGPLGLAQVLGEVAGDVVSRLEVRERVHEPEQLNLQRRVVGADPHEPVVEPRLRERQGAGPVDPGEDLPADPAGAGFGVGAGHGVGAGRTVCRPGKVPL
jgi:hypothetical protein